MDERNERDQLRESYGTLPLTEEFCLEELEHGFREKTIMVNGSYTAGPKGVII